MKKDANTTYFDGEGRPNMEDCLDRAFAWAADEGIKTIVIFTGTGDGPHYAAKEYLPRSRYKALKVVAVTPPVGRLYKSDPSDPSSSLVRAGLSQAMRDELTELGIPVVSAHLPLKEMHTGMGYERTSEWSRVAEAYGALGGGFALCVQAVLLACDAGFVDHGQRVISITADTAIEVTHSCRTESFLSPAEGLLIGHIICRPSRYGISKRLHETIAQPPPNVAPPQLTASVPESAAPVEIVEAVAEVVELPPKKARKNTK